MDVEGWGDQEQEGIGGGKFAAGEVAELLELSTGVMPLHPGPVVEALGQVDVFVGFEFDDRARICL